MGRGVSRSRWAVALVTLAALLAPAVAVADDVAVPVQLQVELLAKVAGYDKNLAARAGDRVRILVLSKSGDADSAHVASQAQSALGSHSSIAGLPVESTVVQFTDAPSLAGACKARRISIVYVSSGFGDQDIQQIAAALDGVSVLTAGALAKFVPKGIILGFDLVEGKPKLLVRLEQARKQHVELSSQVLKLMKVFP